jgi:hypothetical protein
VGILADFIPPFRSLVTVAVSRADFGAPSLHPKIPFPAADLPRANDVATPGILAVLGTKTAGPRLLRIQPERLELPAPLGWSIAQPFDADAARQPTFDRRSNEVRCQES